MQTEHIFNQPINTARFQNYYSFAKTERFSKDARSTSNQYYDVKFNDGQRAPSFGFGERMEWASKHIAPPGLYEAPSQFSGPSAILKSRQEGVSIPLTPRPELFMDELRRLSPGPAKYLIEDDDPKGRTVVMGRLLKQSRNNLPGLDPGKYQPIEAISPRGDYFLSKFSNSRCVKMLSARRFNYKYKETPGPATYKNRRPSRERARSFDKTPRFDPGFKEAIGPGQYFTYSQFR